MRTDRRGVALALAAALALGGCQSGEPATVSTKAATGYPVLEFDTLPKDQVVPLGDQPTVEAAVAAARAAGIGPDKYAVINLPDRPIAVRGDGTVFDLKFNVAGSGTVQRPPRR